MIMNPPSLRGGGSEADELESRANSPWGAGLSSQNGSRKAAPIRPVSARSYQNAAAAERDSPVSGSRLGGAFGRMAHDKGTDFLSGSGAGALLAVLGLPTSPTIQSE